MFVSEKNPIKFCFSDLFGGHGTPCPYENECGYRTRLMYDVCGKSSGNGIFRIIRQKTGGIYPKMTYVMSDLHGHYEKYRKMLEKIAFSEDDELYVLGDVVDRGPQSAQLLFDMSMRPNVYPILGNHDMTAAILLKKLCSQIEDGTCAALEETNVIQMLASWQLDGGQATIRSFKKLPPDEREILIGYLEDFAPYEYIEVNGHKFLLVHGGIPFDKRHLPMEEQDVAALILERPDYSLRYYEDITLVTGHTPTVMIDPHFRGKIYHKNGHLAVDCGAGFDLPLGCVRLEDFEEFYVE